MKSRKTPAPAIPGDEPFLTTTEVARVLQVHPKHVYRLLRRGLPGRRLGGEWRFLRNEVLAWTGVRSESTVNQGLDERGAPVETGAGAGAVVAHTPSVAPFLAANGDVAVELLLSMVNAEKPLLGFVQSDRERALELLREGAVLVAGCHGKEPPAHLDQVRLARIHLVLRDVGLVAAEKEVPRLEDLPRLRFASRPPSAGLYSHLERAAAAQKIPMKNILAGATPLASHRDVVMAVKRGDFDVGLSTRSWADRLGLGFTKLAAESYGLIVRAENLGDRRVVRLCEVAQSEEYRDAVNLFPGYNAKGSGDIRYDRDSAPNIGS